MSSDIDDEAVQEGSTEAEAWTPAAKSSSLLHCNSGKLIAAVQAPLSVQPTIQLSTKVEGIKRRGKRRARVSLPADCFDAKPDLRPAGVFSSDDPFKLTRRLADAASDYFVHPLHRSQLSITLIAIAVCFRRRDTFGSVQYCDEIVGPGGLVRHRHCCYAERVWSAVAAAASKASFACSRATGLEYDAAAVATSATAAVKSTQISSSSATSFRSSAVVAGLRGKLAKVMCAVFTLKYCMYRVCDHYGSMPSSERIRSFCIVTLHTLRCLGR
jgi:hypothetical protein